MGNAGSQPVGSRPSSPPPSRSSQHWRASPVLDERPSSVPPPVAIAISKQLTRSQSLASNSRRHGTRLRQEYSYRGDGDDGSSEEEEGRYDDDDEEGEASPSDMGRSNTDSSSGYGGQSHDSHHLPMIHATHAERGAMHSIPVPLPRMEDVVGGPGRLIPPVDVRHIPIRTGMTPISPFVGSPLIIGSEYATPPSHSVDGAGSLPQDPKVSMGILGMEGSVVTGFHIEGKPEGSATPAGNVESTSSTATQPPSTTPSPSPPTQPIAISWSHGGGDVSVYSSVDGWASPTALALRPGQGVGEQGELSCWSGTVDLPPGTHKIKFRVDEEWRCSPDLLMALDSDGALVNFLTVESPLRSAVRSRVPSPPVDTTAAPTTAVPPVHIPTEPSVEVSKNTPAEASREISHTMPLGSGAEEEEEEEGYGQEIPEPSSYLSTAKGAPPGALARPPILPPHLANPLLNAAAPARAVVDGEEGALPAPVHAIIHHLYACSVRDGVVAVGTTSRYKDKFVTTVYYKPVFD